MPHHQRRLRCSIRLPTTPGQDLASGFDLEKPLCIAIDAYAGEIYEAPGNSVYLCKEMAAVCAAIAERWPMVKPPPGAVI